MKTIEIGKHTVTHSDLMHLNIDDLLNGEQVDIMYSDPPWGQGNLKYWQTMNTKDTGIERNEVSLDLFLNKIFDIASKKVNGLVFIEYGQKWSDNILSLAKEYGLNHLTTIQMQYRSGSRLLPLDLHIFGEAEIKQEYIDSVYNTYGFDSLKKALAPFCKEGMKLLDPCCGMGYTAQIAKDNNCTFFGNELNRKRLQKTIDRLNG